MAALDADDEGARWTADNVLRRLGYPTFEHHLRALAERPLREHSWMLAASQCPPERSGELVAAARTLPLDDIASGPGNALGLGQEHVAHRCLDAVVRALPELGVLPWDLINAALQSPVLRNRHGALSALESTERTLWPSEAVAQLRHHLTLEPDAKVREVVARLLEL